MQAVADRFGTAFGWVVAISAGRGLPLLWLIPAERRAARLPEDQTLTPSAASSL